MSIHPDIKTVLITKEQIQEKITELAAQISRDYKSGELVLVSVLKGGVMFLADLSRKITIDHSYDMVGAMSYGKSTTSSGNVIITKDIDIDVSNQDVLLIEDIYDSGRTLQAVKDLISLHSPRSLAICCLLYKQKAKKVVNMPIKYVGFYIPDIFVVGYGLDYAEKYRNLEYIGVLKESVYS